MTGVGTRAVRASDDYGPTADGNRITCAVSASVDQIPAAAGLIKGGHSITLTASQSNGVATALGTLCNRIFGGGSTTPDLSVLHS